MPTVLKQGPYRFFFVALNRAEPPHIHAQRDALVAKFWLDPIMLHNAGGFSRKELGAVAELVEKHKTLFLEKWHEFFGN